MFLIHYYKTCPLPIKHSTEVPVKLGQLYQSGLLEIFYGSASELEHLRKLPFRFHHATIHSTKLHSCPLGTSNIHHFYQN